MKVYFIGAGPGAADLITLRGATLLGRVGMVLYAGSLVSKDMLVHSIPPSSISNSNKPVINAHGNKTSMSRDCIPAIPPFTAPPPNKCAAWMRWT